MKLGSSPIGQAQPEMPHNREVPNRQTLNRNHTTQLQGIQCNNATQPEEEVAAQDLAVLVPGAHEVDRVDRLALLTL